MKFIVWLLAACLLGIPVKAKLSGDTCLTSKLIIKYFNGFQHTCRDPEKINTALLHAQNLARICPPSLRSLFQPSIHNLSQKE